MYNIGRHRKRLPSLLTAILALMITTTVIDRAANAQTAWPVAVKQVPLGGLLTSAQGAVTVSSCSTWGQYAHQFETYDRNGKLIYSVPNNPQNYGFCNGSTWAVGSDGTQYMQYRAASDRPWQVRAIKGSTTLWTAALPHTCGAKSSELMYLSVGKNNVVYALSREDACTSKTVHLTYVNGSTGAILRDVFVGTPGSFCCYTVSGLAPYDSGVAVWAYNSLYYYNASGVMIKSHYSPADGAQIAANHLGRTFLSTIASNGRCPGGVQSTQVKSYQPTSDTAKAYTFSTPCVRVLSVMPMPDGGALVRVRFDSATVKLLRLDANLAYKWLLPLPAEAGSVRDGSDLVHLSVDTKGNVLTVQNVISANKHYGVLAHLLDGNTGAVRAAYSSLAVDPSSRLRLVGPMTVALSPGKMYLGLRRCTYDSYDLCRSSNGDYLYQISFAEMGMDYPRGTLLGAPNPPPAQVYAALGDSFSSGEGNPSFEVGTDTAGPPQNRCHRSKTAYPYLLANDPALTLNSPLFVACSGAGTWNVANGQWNEGPQLQAVGKYTNVVTISIGGNDIDFRLFVTDCFNPTVDCSTDSYDSSMAKVGTLPSKLRPLLKSIRERSPNAKIYLVGYPEIVALDESGKPKRCSYNRLLTDEEVVAGWRLIRNLDDILSDVVTALRVTDRQIYFVDPRGPQGPFAGHDLCGVPKYFHELVPTHPEYTFHPNEDGQKAYARLIAKVIAAA